MSAYSIENAPSQSRDIAYWEGDHRQIGRLQARFLLKHRNPLYQEFIYDYVDGDKSLDTVLTMLPKPMTHAELEAFKRLMAHWLPHQLEELEGFAEELGMPLNSWLKILGSITANAGCTGIALAPSRTNNGHVLIAYNHDFHPALDEKLLVLRRPKQGFATLGNAAVVLGLYDGLNENGLYIASSLVLSRPRKQALFFAFVIRHVLENAANTEQAVALLSRMPGRDSYNYLIADQHGQLAVVEKNRGQVAVRYPQNGYLITSNHFQAAEMIDRNEQIMPNSVWRVDRSQRYIQEKGRISTTELRDWINQPLKDGGIALDFYEPFILGRLYGYTLDLNDKRLSFQLDPSSTPLELSMTQWLLHPPKRDETGWVQKLEAALKPGAMDLTAFGDLDWWAAPGYGRPVLFTQVAGSVNPLGLMLENRLGYRQGTDGNIWGPYWEGGLRQLLSPVFHRHGLYFRYTSKRWFEIELGYEWMHYFRGISEQHIANGYLENDPFKRLQAGTTSSFSSRSPRIAISLQGSIGPIAAINQTEIYNWSKPASTPAFFNFETNLSQAFGGEMRNTLMLLSPLGTPRWSAGIFSQWNQLLDEPGWTSFSGVQLNLLRTNGLQEGLLRLGNAMHGAGQPNAPTGTRLMMVYKRWWR